MAVYFCGTDLYNCLPFVSKSESKDELELSQKNVFKEPSILPNVSKIVYGHFYAIYQKADSSSWLISSLGSPEKEIFPAEWNIKEVAVSSNLIIGLSEDGNLYRITIEVDDDQQSESGLKFSEVSSPTTGKANLTFSKVAANDLHIYGLNSSPELSRIYKIDDESLELIAEFSGKHIMDLCVGHGHFVARSDTGALWNWGHSGRSELANCGEISSMTVCKKPQRVSFFDDLPCIVTKIVCGGWHTLALTSDGDIYSWGWNESGQLGHDSAVSSKSDPYPVDLGSADDPVIDVAAGSRHSVALLKSGLVYSWGRNLEGQGGAGHLNSCSKPQPMPKSWSGVAKKVECGKWSTFVFTE